MKVMSRKSENGEEGEISVVKEASHDVRNYVMKLWNGSSGRGIWRWPTFLSFAIDLDFDEQFPEGNAATFLRSKWKFMTKTTMDRKERSSRLLRKGRLRDEDYVSSSLLVSPRLFSLAFIAVTFLGEKIYPRRRRRDKHDLPCRWKESSRVANRPRWHWPWRWDVSSRRWVIVVLPIDPSINPSFFLLPLLAYLKLSCFFANVKFDW